MTLPEKTIALPSGDIALWDTQGPGVPIVMLHGVGASRRVFSRQIESPLADQHRLIAIDLPGHGQSSDSKNPDADYSIPALADLVAGVLVRLDVTRAIIVGWSMGGHIAIEMMARHGQAFAGAMLCGAAPVSAGPINMLRGFHVNWDLLLASRATYSFHDAVRFARICYGTEANGSELDTILRADGRMRARANRSLLRGDGTDQRTVVETSPIPLAIVNGAAEPVVRLNYIDHLAYANLWEGKCHTIEGAAHVPFLSAPHRFNAILQRFAADMAVSEKTRSGLPPAKAKRSGSGVKFDPYSALRA